MTHDTFRYKSYFGYITEFIARKVKVSLVNYDYLMGNMWYLFYFVQSPIAVIFTSILYQYYHRLFFIVLRKLIMVSREPIMCNFTGFMLFLFQVPTTDVSKFYSRLTNNMSKSKLYVHVMFSWESKVPTWRHACWNELWHVYIGDWFGGDEELGTWFGTMFGTIEIRHRNNPLCKPIILISIIINFNTIINVDKTLPLHPRALRGLQRIWVRYVNRL